MRIVTFDIETANWMDEVGSGDPADLSIAVVGIHDSETDQYSCFLEHELPGLWAILERTDMLVGFNSDHFDIPLLNKYYPGDLTRIKSLDLLQEVHRALGRRLKLDTLAEATLGERKIGDGLQSLRWWKQGEVEKVKLYCQKDVELTKRIFDYALENNALKYRDLGTLKEIKLNTSKWLVTDAKPMTFSMGF
ncbi:ribonuclease H-like domain-containing protein [Candidatus Kaiserbacteria bacterium]|nr:ribonuclease H-like domain-containing protein [Candidatus Kaiserbacteria bacterium]